MQSKRIQAWPSLNNDTSHLLPQRTRVRACAWPSCACVHERALHVRLVCMRACRMRVLTSVRARRRLVCVRDRHVCAFTSVRCIDVSCACAPCACCHERACASTYRVRVRRRRVLTSVRARRRLVCVRDRHACAVTSVRHIDVSCACLLFVAGARELWTVVPFPAGDGYPQLSIMISYGLLHARLACRTMRLVRSKACDRMRQLYASLVTEQFFKHRCT